MVAPVASRPRLLFVAVIGLGLLAGAAVVASASGLADLRIVLLVPASAAVLLATAYFPGVILAAYFLIAFYKAAVQPFSPIDVTIVLAILNAVQAVPLVRSRVPGTISAAGLTLWVCLGLLLLVGILYAPDPALATQTTIQWWLLVAIPLAIGALRVGSEARFVRQFLWAILATSFLTVAVGLGSLSDSTRLVVLGNNTIGVSRAALLVPLLVVAFAIHGVGWRARLALLATLPAAFVVAVASGSRGPIVVLGVLGVVAAIRASLRGGRVNPRPLAGLAAAVLAAVVVLSSVSVVLPEISIWRYQVFADLVGSTLEGDVNTSVGDTSSGIRLQMFGLAIRLFEENPVVGVGTAGFESLSPRYLSPREAEAYPHNPILQFAAEFGLVGLVLYAALVAVAATRRLPARPEYVALKALFAFFLLNAMVSGDIYTDRQIWALLMLVLMAAVDPVAASVRRRAVSRPAAQSSVARPSIEVGRPVEGWQAGT